jgi:hypothetical protein
MTSILNSIHAEYERYQTLAERSLAQIPGTMLGAQGPSDGNILTTIAWHVAGNLRSRIMAFLTEDCEKPWRNRDDEFAARVVSRAELDAQWTAGWTALYDALPLLTQPDLQRTITIRGQPLHVHDALHRSLAHVCYHVEQIVYIAHAHRGDAWEYLSIPPGRARVYNAAPTHETPGAHIAKLSGGAPAHRDGTVA